MQTLKINPFRIFMIGLILFCISSAFEVMDQYSTDEQVYHTNAASSDILPANGFPSRGTYANIKLWDDLGENAEDRFGMSVASAGDIDNDSYEDFIIGCGNNDDAGMDAGKVYIYRGGRTISKNPFWQKKGEAWNHKFGSSAASAGDVNNDGFDDVIIGAPQYRDGNTYKGKAYIYLGGSSMGGAAFWTCLGESQGDIYGCSVASAGDVNNDGFDDVIVGAKDNDGNGNNRGKAYVYLGGTEMSNTPFWAKTGEQDNDDYGISVAGAGNVNGDEYDDIIIGARNNDERTSGAGKAYVHLGGSSISMVPFWEGIGELEYENFGQCVASAGDVNSDGFDDVIIGAPGSDESYDKAGKVYVFIGGTPMNLTSFCEINGESKADEFGSTAARGGDVNGDGFDDIIVGSLFNDDGGNDAGKSYVYLGGSSINESTFWTKTGEKKEDRFAYSVSSAGDVNNDGYDDVIIGAIANDAGGNNAGKGYVYAIMTNNPPEVSNLSIEPSETRTNDKLRAQYNFTDTDDDLENGTVIRWYRDGVVIKELNDKRIVYANFTSKGENWSFSVQPGDGLTTGEIFSSPNRTILNTPPVVGNLRILPVNPKTTDKLSVNYTFSDADNDSESGSKIRWYKNGSLMEEYNDFLTISASATSRNMSWNATIVPYDGEEFGQVVSSSQIRIGNSLPSVSGMHIDPPYPKTDDNLTALWNFSDPDKNSENGTEIKWYQNYVHLAEYDDHQVISSNATEKNEIWYFTVRPGDGEDHGSMLTSLNTVILNTAPTCAPVSPMNATVIISENVLLLWNSSDTDNDSLTYNVYLDNNNGTSQIVSDLDNAYWKVTDLVNGIYYWRVEAFDGEETSMKNSTSLSFVVNVTPEDFVPVVRLDYPENNSIINDTSVELRWTPLGDLIPFLTYDVYFGTEITPTLIAENITSLNYSVDKLEDQTTYYWKVIPKLGDLKGICIGGTNSFEVRKGFIPVHDVTLSLEREKVRIIKGAVGSVKIDIENRGNLHESINLSILGDLEDRIVFTPLFYLSPGEMVTTTIKIITNDEMEPGKFILTIRVNYLGEQVESELEVIIIEENEIQSPERSSGSAWLWSSIVVVILLTLIVIITILTRSKKRTKSEVSEEGFADIEHVPTGGIRSEMPTAQIIAPVMEKTNMAGSIQYGYIRREPMIRGPMETLPNMQSTEGQHSDVGFEQSQMYPAAYGNTIQDMETGSSFPINDGVPVTGQVQEIIIAGELQTRAAPTQALLPQTAGQGTSETEAEVPPIVPNQQAQAEQFQGLGTSAFHVSVPSEEQKNLEKLEQPKLPQAPNPENLSGL